MSKYLSLLKSLVFLTISVCGVSISYAQFPSVSAQCWPVYANYSNCQQLGSAAQGPAAIEFCKQAIETWVTSGCAAQAQCMQNNFLPQGAPPMVVKELCPLSR